MIKIYTSYFYQVRFFKHNIIPLSTAKWDPKWFHAFKGSDYIFKDKNQVFNGLRAEPFVPGPGCDGDCRGMEFCDNGNPQKCNFLRHYRQQLNTLDFQDIIKRFEALGNRIRKDEGFLEEPEMVLLVHEAPNNPCSERVVIRQWFAANGLIIPEWQRDLIL